MMNKVAFDKTAEGMELMAAFLDQLRYHGREFRTTADPHSYIVELL